MENYRRLIDRTHALFGQLPARSDYADDLLSRIREVVLIVSSSRGGSSVFTETLRHCDALLHFQAEINPFLALSGLTFPFSGTDSDSLTPAQAAPATALNRLFAWHIGTRKAELEDPRFALDLWWRLGVQWPELELDVERVQRWVTETLAELGPTTAGSPAPTTRADRFHALFLRRAHQAEPRINPYYYDVNAEQIAACCPAVPLPEGPPGPFILEEPPFVAIGPWQNPTVEELARRPLVIKTPSNAYRLAFLRALFPNARVRLLHLTRHPGAAINGLLDGWRYRGFHSHRVDLADARLAISGYSDRLAGAEQWWKFDLPPGWREWTARPLAEVCAFQWCQSHRAILADTDYPSTDRDDYLRVRFEDTVAEPVRRHACFARVAEWLGVEVAGCFGEVIEHGLPPIMATSRPRQRRWYEKAADLAPVLARGDVQELTEELGYADEHTDL